MSDPAPGRLRVAKMKRVVIGFSEEVLAEIDGIGSETNQCRSDVIRQACHMYLEEKKKAVLREQMRVGYRRMGEINRLLAEEIASDFDDMDFTGDETREDCISRR